jgi:hypothetical protein
MSVRSGARSCRWDAACSLGALMLRGELACVGKVPGARRPLPGTLFRGAATERGSSTSGCGHGPDADRRGRKRLPHRPRHSASTSGQDVRPAPRTPPRPALSERGAGGRSSVDVRRRRRTQEAHRRRDVRCRRLDVLALQTCYNAREREQALGGDRPESSCPGGHAAYPSDSPPRATRASSMRQRIHRSLEWMSMLFGRSSSARKN